VHAIGTGDYNADRQAIAHARGELALYISRLENPGELDVYQEAYETMLKAPTIEDARERANTLHTDIQGVKDRTCAVATSHGRESVLGILRQFNAAKVHDLKLGDLWSYCLKLEQLADTPNLQQFEAERVRQAVMQARKLYQPTHGMFTASGYAEHMFNAGREFQKNS